MLAIGAFLVSFVLQEAPEVDAHVQTVRSLTDRLQNAGFPDLASWVLIRLKKQGSNVKIKPADVYIWVDPSGSSDRAYTLSGREHIGTKVGEVVRLDELNLERQNAADLAHGASRAPRLDNALLTLMSAGRPDLVKRIIVRDWLYSYPLADFENRLLLSLILPVYNDSTHLYSRGQFSQARASLLPALAWLLQTVPIAPQISPASTDMSIEVVYLRSFILAAELRRRLRDEDESVFDYDLAMQMNSQEKLEYLALHLDEATAITATPGGAGFGFSSIALAFKSEGDNAKPVLQEIIDTDPRLTKVTYSRFDGMPLYIYSVADVAWQILQSIEGAMTKPKVSSGSQ